jgi:dTDP-4-amino-4,6-dideoxygalactose transaminase
MKKFLKFNNPINFLESINNCKSFINEKSNLHGPGKNIFKIKKLLKDQFRFENCLLTNSCTSALEIAALTLMQYSNDKKNEIIIPSYSFVTSGSSFVKANFKLRYINISENNLMPTFADIKKAVNKKTKAVVLTHYQGYSVDYLDQLSLFCKKKNIYLIEDAAQALGSYFKKKPLGSFGDFSTFSFHYTKNFQSGIGGCLVINNKKFLKLSQYIYDKGTNRNDQILNKQLRYSWVAIGGSFLMSELHASYLYPQLLKMNKLIKYRKKIFNYYLKKLNKFNNLFRLIYYRNQFKYNYHAIAILCNTRKIKEVILDLMNLNRIEFFTGYVPLHTTKFSKNKKKYKLKQTENLYSRTLRLPLNNHISNTEINKIEKLLVKNFKKI